MGSVCCGGDIKAKRHNAVVMVDERVAEYDGGRIEANQGLKQSREIEGGKVDDEKSKIVEIAKVLEQEVGECYEICDDVMKELEIGPYFMHGKVYEPLHIKELQDRNMEDFLLDLHLSPSTQISEIDAKIQNLCNDNYSLLRKLMVLKEPPISLRWPIWRYMASNSKTVDKSKFVSIIDTAISSKASQTLIQNDVDRTFCHKAFYSRSVYDVYIGKHKLRRLCTAVDVYFKHIRYTQGMSLILGVILQVSGGNEYESFNFYLHLMKARKLQLYSIIDDYFTVKMFLTYMFKAKLKQIHPRLYDHVVSIDFPDDCWIGKWWISLFAGYVDDYLVVRIIDFLLVTSLMNIVDVALAICTVLHDKLLQSDMIDFNMIVKDLNKQAAVAGSHPNRLVGLASSYSSEGVAVYAMMQAFVVDDSTSAPVRGKMAKIMHDYRAYLEADGDDNDDVGHDDISMSVFTVNNDAMRSDA